MCAVQMIIGYKIVPLIVIKDYILLTNIITIIIIIILSIIIHVILKKLQKIKILTSYFLNIWYTLLIIGRIK